MLQNTKMKVLTSKKINAFGGLNFVHNELEKLDIEEILNTYLPKLSPQSKYSWKDIFYTFLSIYFTGGECIEDTKTVLSNHFGYSPFFDSCSPDTILRRMASLSIENENCTTPRGTVDHVHNFNKVMANLNIAMLKSLGTFDQDDLVLDYDNTIVFAEKSDCKMTYKKAYGYQPGVCYLNEEQVLFIENRNGNSDAKSFQDKTLLRMFESLKENNIEKPYKFRADGASYQFDVIKLLKEQNCLFYIAARNSYVEKYFQEVDHWKKTKDKKGDPIEIGEIIYKPFVNKYRKGNEVPSYRLLIKRKVKPDHQGDLFTSDAYDYNAIATNDHEVSLEDGLTFYYHRGAVERQFDTLKNDFGWNNMPFSTLSKNSVFLYFTAIFKNLYKTILTKLSSQYAKVNIKHRMKRFIFSFVTLPALWVKRARQWQLRIYGTLQLRN